MIDDFGNFVADKATVASINSRFDSGEKRMKRIETDLADNTQATHQISTSINELVDFFNAMKGAMKVLDWIGRLARPLGAIVGLVAALATIWATMKGGS